MGFRSGQPVRDARGSDGVRRSHDHRGRPLSRRLAEALLGRRARQPDGRRCSRPYETDDRRRTAAGGTDGHAPAEPGTAGRAGRPRGAGRHRQPDPRHRRRRRAHRPRRAGHGTAAGPGATPHRARPARRPGGRAALRGARRGRLRPALPSPQRCRGGSARLGCTRGDGLPARRPRPRRARSCPSGPTHRSSRPTPGPASPRR